MFILCTTSYVEKEGMEAESLRITIVREMKLKRNDRSQWRQKKAEKLSIVIFDVSFLLSFSPSRNDNNKFLRNCFHVREKEGGREIYKSFLSDGKYVG